MPTVIAIGGPPGSGKTTVAALLSKKKGYRLVSAGQLFREMAKERGLSLEEFGELASRDHTIDVELDQTVAREVKALVAKGEDVVVEGRLQAILLERESLEPIKVWLDAPIGIRVERIAGRESKSEETVFREVEERQSGEVTRYGEIYGIDLDDLSAYDVVLDTVDRTPSEVVDILAQEVDL